MPVSPIITGRLPERCLCCSRLILPSGRGSGALTSLNQSSRKLSTIHAPRPGHKSPGSNSTGAHTNTRAHIHKHPYTRSLCKHMHTKSLFSMAQTSSFSFQYTIDSLIGYKTHGTTLCGKTSVAGPDACVCVSVCVWISLLSGLLSLLIKGWKALSGVLVSPATYYTSVCSPSSQSIQQNAPHLNRIQLLRLMLCGYLCPYLKHVLISVSLKL